jgi:hypothetical protein
MAGEENGVNRATSLRELRKEAMRKLQKKNRQEEYGYDFLNDVNITATIAAAKSVDAEAGQKAPPVKRKKRKADDDSDADSEEEEVKKPAKKRQRTAKTSTKKQNNTEVKTRKQQVKTTQKQKRKKQPLESASEDDEADEVDVDALLIDDAFVDEASTLTDDVGVRKDDLQTRSGRVSKAKRLVSY